MGLYDNDETFQKLRARFEGKTVLKVEPPRRGLDSECVARFTMSDGEAFSLHATELGCWTKDIVATGDKYSDLKTVFLDCGNYLYAAHNFVDGELQKPTVTIQGDDRSILTIKTFDGRRFVADISRFPNWDRTVALHDRGPELIAQGCTSTEFWKLVFGPKNDRCPPELYFHSDIS